MKKMMGGKKKSQARRLMDEIQINKIDHLKEGENVSDNHIVKLV